MRRLVMTCVALILSVMGLGVAASAEPPLDITGPITDNANALTDTEVEQVEAALDDFYNETGRQLFVVYVDSFDGLSGSEWAAQTATESGLGPTDVLLAVALRQRSYGYDADAEDFSDSDLQKVDRDYILPKLRNDDWAGAAIGAAEGLTDVSGSSGPWGWLVAAGFVGAGGAGYLVHRQRRRYDRTHRVVDEHGEPVDPAALLSDEELEAAASKALVEIDDALQSSAQELGYAEAQFGSENTTEFRTVLVDGRARIREAFTLQQQLDDAEPETDEQRRAMLSKILKLCDEVDTALDAQVERFNSMRDLQHRAPEAIAALEPRLEATAGRLDQSRAIWQELTKAFPGQVLAAVSGNLARAESLLASANDRLEQSRQAVTSADTADAAVHLRVAEDATAQAGSLLDALATTRDELTSARDNADDLLSRVSVSVSTASAFIQANTAAVRSGARTRLSEAARLLDGGRQLIDEHPQEATERLERADQLVQEAQAAADADVAAWRAGQERDHGSDGDLVLGGILGGGSSRSSGGWGGRSRSSSRRSSSRSSSSRRSSSRSSSRRSSSSRSRRSGGGSSRRSGGGRF